MKKIAALLIFIVSLIQTHAQVGINTDNSNPDSSAILDIKSTNQGIVIPRMTTLQRDSISSPAIGLTIFNLDDQCQDSYDGTNWMKDCPMQLTPDSLIVKFWTQKNNFPGVQREGAVGFSVNGKAYIGTGRDNNLNTLSDFWEYNPDSDIWIEKSNFPGNPRHLAVGFTINGKLYIGTGLNGSSALDDFWEYDPTTNAWTPKARFLGVARYSAVGFSINGKGYIGTGRREDGLVTFTDFWEYDPTTNAWTQKAGFLDQGDLMP